MQDSSCNSDMDFICRKLKILYAFAVSANVIALIESAIVKYGRMLCHVLESTHHDKGDGPEHPGSSFGIRLL